MRSRSTATYAFVDRAFRDGLVSATGMAITAVLPPVSRFSPTGDRAAKKQAMLAKLADYFDRFFGLG
ncbi:MAG: hypothetical protein JW722_07195 [Demequinaceae bacterium]|nr:hypothetical protein [Demequinaceae bacterium]